MIPELFVYKECISVLQVVSESTQEQQDIM